MDSMIQSLMFLLFPLNSPLLIEVVVTQLAFLLLFILVLADSCSLTRTIPRSSDLPHYSRDAVPEPRDLPARDGKLLGSSAHQVSTVHIACGETGAITKAPSAWNFPNPIPFPTSHFVSIAYSLSNLNHNEKRKSRFPLHPRHHDIDPATPLLARQVS